jgi:hypothetical protein
VQVNDVTLELERRREPLEELGVPLEIVTGASCPNLPAGRLMSYADVSTSDSTCGSIGFSQYSTCAISRVVACPSRWFVTRRGSVAPGRS